MVAGTFPAFTPIARQPLAAGDGGFIVQRSYVLSGFVPACWRADQWRKQEVAGELTDWRRAMKALREVVAEADSTSRRHHASC